MANLRILFDVANISIKFFATSAIFLLFHTVSLFHLSSHPASSAIRGVVQSLSGVGEQGVALFLQIDEVTIGSVGTTGRETAGGVGRDEETTGSGGKDLAADEKQVTEGTVRGIGAARRPGTALVGGHLDGVVAWVNAEEFSFGEEATAGFDDLWHSMMFIGVLYFICFYVFSLTARLRHSHHRHDRKEKKKKA